MKAKRIVVFGAGGHAKVVVDVLQRMGGHEIVGLLDDSAELSGTVRRGYRVLGGREQFTALQSKGVDAIIIALGNNQHRKAVYEEAKRMGIALCSAIDPSAQIGGGVVVGSGSVLVAGTVVNVDAEIGDNVIVNTGATVDHDCCIGAHAHLSPGVHLGGRVTVGESAHVGIGAVVLPNLVIGKYCVVGAGSVVRENVPDGAVVAGNPARIIKQHEVVREP